MLIPGARAPKLVTRDMLGRMKPGAVLVDVAIDQGGCFETSRPTTHSDPIYEVDGIVHYCVANMPGAVPISSTKALTNVTLPYVELIADLGVRGGRRAQPGRSPAASTSPAARSPTSRRRGARPPVTPLEEALPSAAVDGTLRSAVGSLAGLALAAAREELDHRVGDPGGERR